ncbi:hypothetical protein JXA02_14460 [candidate division KSB1 bacterium]|nr:hypothetical protein [candidate division KSB1 bacterium]RQW01706.1 MAG: hypothetical protein EH222_14705 [candidate division KSB1 bacterium]
MTEQRRSMLVVLFSLAAAAHLTAAPQADVRALVAADSGKYYIDVKNLILDFVFSGYGLYSPGDFPILTEFPLQNGERVRFDRIKEITLSPERLFWKEYVGPEKRQQYANVDEQGYRHWSDIEINVRLIDWEGNLIRSRLRRPEYSDIFLRGETSRGVFELELDQENGNKVHIVFRPNYVMQCTGNKSHLFPNSTYKFCPLCGHSLIKLTRENVRSNAR